jgi:hypothetical protein
MLLGTWRGRRFVFNPDKLAKECLVGVRPSLFSDCSGRIIDTCVLADDGSLIFRVKRQQLNQQLHPTNSSLFSFFHTAGSGRSKALLSHGQQLRYRHRISFPTGNVWKIREKWYSLMGKARKNLSCAFAGISETCYKCSLVTKPNSGRLRCDTLPLGKWFPKFRRNLSSIFKGRQSKLIHIPEDVNPQQQHHCMNVMSHAQVPSNCTRFHSAET